MDLDRGGIILVDKDAGMTSHDVVGRVRRLAGTRRVGHCGTLDPGATGLLIVVLGRSTRLAQYITEGEKGYRGEVVFGVTTSTDDGDGDVLEERPCRAADGADIDDASVKAAAARFTGVIKQRPPRRSAIKVGGERLYKKHLRGEEFEVPEREVTITSIDVLSFGRHTQSPVPPANATPLPSGDSAPPHPVATIEVVCSKGTYIRSIARDMGESLGCGAHLGSLQRTMIGRFALEDARTLDELSDLAAEGRLGEALLSPEEAVSHLPAVVVPEPLKFDVLNGRKLPWASVTPELPASAGTRANAVTAIVLTDDAGMLLAICRPPRDEPVPVTRYDMVFPEQVVENGHDGNL